MEKTYDHVNKKPQWFRPVRLRKYTTKQLGTYICVVFLDEPDAVPEFTARLSSRQLTTLRSSNTVLRTQRELDDSRNAMFKLLCCEQSVTIVPYQLEQDTAAVDTRQTRLSCYCLVLDIIAKALEKMYGI